MPRNNSANDQASNTANFIENNQKALDKSLAIVKQPEPEPIKDSLESSHLKHSSKDLSISKLVTNVSPFQSPDPRAKLDEQKLK